MNKEFTISVRAIVRVLFAVLFTASCVANIYLASENVNLERVNKYYVRANIRKQNKLDSINCKNEPSYHDILVTH